MTCFRFRAAYCGLRSTMGDVEENEEFTPFRPFTRESLFNIERRIAEEKAAKVIKENELHSLYIFKEKCLTKFLY